MPQFMMHGPGLGAGPRMMRMHDDEPRPKSKMGTLVVLKRIMGFASSYWYLMVSLVATMIIHSWLSAMPVRILPNVVDTAIAGGENALGRIKYLVILYVAISIAGNLINAFNGYLRSLFGSILGHNMRERVYRHMQRLSLSFYENQKTGDIMSRTVGDAEVVATGLMGPLSWIGGSLTTFVFATYYLVTLNINLTVVYLTAALLMSVAVYMVAGITRRLHRQNREAHAELWSMLQENVSGVKEIQSFTREDFEQQKFSSQSMKVKKLSVFATVISNLLRIATDVIMLAATAVVWWIGAKGIMAGEVNPGQMMAFVTYGNMLVGPLVQLAFQYDGFQRVIVSAERVFEVLDLVPDVENRKDAVPLEKVKGMVEFENVTFSYDKNVEVLRNFSIKAEPGQIIALVGPSGSGKSTVCKLLLRFYDPDGGAVKIDGRDIREYTLESVRGSIGVVFQDTFLFNNTIRENISFGREDATMEEIMEAAKAADAHDFIMELPNGYETIVGERGVKLSGGQKQRIAIARAILKDPKILVLDEATSSVDTMAEERIYQALDRLMVGRTSFVIAHRLSTIQNADKIVVLKDGEIAEVGTHESLLQQGGVYSELWSARTAGECKEAN